MNLVCLSSLSTGLFCMLFYRLLIFFKIAFSEKFFQEYHQSVKQFGPRSDLKFRSQDVGPDLDPNCLQRLSADDTSRQS